ncbi:MAG: hypothetical protein J5J00_00120, partial [Deltaproteobacteria bacterium]|nr:hypothetical protein [Deltaproteobacteria bacterium]
SAELQKKSPQLSTEVALMQMLLDPNQKVSLRTMVAQQFEDMDVITQIIDGEDGSTIISERNKVALDVLRKELAKGKKRIGIFYGAGHMPDLERRLKSDFKLSCKKLEWVTAWNLNSQ